MSCTIDLSITPLRIIPCHIAHFCRVISHSYRDIQHALLDKSFSVSNRGKQCYRDTYCFAYFICAYPCQMSRLACRVIARVPVSSPFYLFSRGGSHMLRAGVLTYQLWSFVTVRVRVKFHLFDQLGPVRPAILSA